MKRNVLRNVVSGVFRNFIFTAGFDPLSLNPLVWFDAGDEDTITTSGGRVSQWDDKSGNDNHATQATVSDQPAYSGTINGLNVIDVSDGGGSSNHLEFASSFDVKEFYAVLNLSTTSRVFICRDASGSEEVNLRLANGGEFNFDFNGTAAQGAYSINGGSYSTSAVSHTSTGQVSGVSQVAGKFDVVSDVRSILGRSGELVDDQFSIAEIIMFGSELNSTQKSNIENYLQTKWSI